MKYIGISNMSANNQARGFEKQAPKNPKEGTNTKPAIERAIISITPAKIAIFAYPMPCMRKRVEFTSKSRTYPALLIERYNFARGSMPRLGSSVNIAAIFPPKKNKNTNARIA